MSVLPANFSYEQAIWSLVEPLRKELPANACVELLCCFLLLRWAAQIEAVQEAMAVIEERSYLSLLPPWLQWQPWVHLQDSTEIGEQLKALAVHLSQLRSDPSHPLTGYLHALALPIRRALTLPIERLIDLARGIGALPFETPNERRALLEPFDLVLAQATAAATFSMPMRSDAAKPTLSGGARLEQQSGSPKSIARLAAAIADPRAGERVYDPCFGHANFLVAAWLHAEAKRNEPRRAAAPLDVAGFEIDPSAFLIGLTRLVLAGTDTPRIEIGDSLERDPASNLNGQGFDVVLASPPIGVKTSRDPWRYQHFPIRTQDHVGLFIQHALSQLKPHGRAAIVVPEGFLFRAGGVRDLRRHLIEQGQVEAVVGLPAAVFSQNRGVKYALLVLTKAGGPKRVRMMDLAPLLADSPSAPLSSFISDKRSQRIAAVLRQSVLHGRNIEDPSDASEQALVADATWDLTPEEIAETDWDLTPRRREKGGLEELLANLKESLGEAGEIAPLSEVAKITAGRPIKSADLLDEPPEGRAVGYIRIKDLTQDSVGRCSSWLSPMLADMERRWSLVAGDVLVSKSGTIGKTAMVRNGAAGAVAANGLYVLRTDQSRLDPGFLLAYLASPACKNWLAAQARGTMIQHLNRPVLERLPVPLPPMAMQVQVADLYRDFGTADALAYLAELAGGKGSNRMTGWLAELSHHVSRITETRDAPPALTQLEPLAAMASAARPWIEKEIWSKEDVTSADQLINALQVSCVDQLTDALSCLAGVADIPPGPGLLALLQESEHRMGKVIDDARKGYVPDRLRSAELQVRNIAERLRDWLRTAITNLTNRCSIAVRTEQSQLEAGSFAEFSLDLVNEGVLPLRTLRVETMPDWGAMDAAYVPEQGVVKLNLRGDAPKQASTLALGLSWSARNLIGQSVSGSIELSLQVVEPAGDKAPSISELGGSPYVTGTPLEPKRGHSVFFGRQELIERISRQVISHGNVILLEGNRRAGKTSILKHLEGRDTIPGWFAVYASFQKLDDARTSTIFRLIAVQLARGISSLGVETPLPDGTEVDYAALISHSKIENLAELKRIRHACQQGIDADLPFADFSDYVETLLTVIEPLDLKLLLMLDEFDKLQEGIDLGQTSPHVPENIRFLIQTYPRFSAILTGSRRLKRLREEYWSALYGLGISEQVTALDPDSARCVVTEPVRGRLNYSNEAIERILQVTARQPYLMQCVCNKIFDYAVRIKIRSITLGVVNEIATAWVRDNEHFATVWGYAGLGPETGRRRRQLILMHCAQAFKQGMHLGFGALREQLAQCGVDVVDELLDTDLAYLRELELLDLDQGLGDGYYQLTIPLMADWMDQQQDANVVASRARVEAEEEHG